MVRSVSNIESLEEIRRAFSTSYKCGLYLRRLRWPKGVTCPRCGAKHPGHISSRKLWQCRACRYQFSVTTGTIFHRSKIDLPRWFVAIWLMCNSPKGISAKQLERDLGVHYETAWYMAKRIRRAMKHDIFEDKLCGIVEIDDAVVKSDKGTRWAGGSYVLGMASRSGDIKLQILKKLQGAEVRRVVAEDEPTSESLFSFQHFLVHPNPFDDHVRFGFIGEGEPEIITVIVFDPSGRRVWEGQASDTDELLWDGRRFDERLAASAPYICTITLIENGRLHRATGKVFIQR